MFHDLVIIIFWRPTQRTEMIDWMGKNMMSVGFSKFLSLTLTLHLPASHSQCGAGLNHEFKTETLQINCVTLLMVGPAHTAYPQRKTALKLWLIITWNAMIVVTGNQGQVIILILTWDGWEGNQLPALSSRSLSWHCHTWEPGMRSLAQPGHHHQSSISLQDFQTNPRLQGPSVYPPRNCLFLLNEQSLAYFVQIAPSSLFDESLAAWWHPPLWPDPVQARLCRAGLGRTCDDPS